MVGVDMFYASNFQGPQGWQLQNLLEVGRLIIHAAFVRTETRGVHVRSDYPATSDNWRVHLCWQREVAEPWQTAIESGSPAGFTNRGLFAGDNR